MVQDKQKACLNEIIKKVNDLFAGELTEQDKLVHVNNVVRGKLLESEKLVQQAANNMKEQFANSPDLKNELINAIIDALEAHTTMSTQALEWRHAFLDRVVHYATAFANACLLIGSKKCMGWAHSSQQC